MHMNLPPICFARSVCCAPSGVVINGTIAIARSAATAARERALVMALSQSDRRSQYLWQRLRGGMSGARQHQHCALIGQQRDQRAEYHHDAAEPDPLDQRVQV